MFPAYARWGPRPGRATVQGRPFRATGLLTTSSQDSARRVWLDSEHAIRKVGTLTGLHRGSTPCSTGEGHSTASTSVALSPVRPPFRDAQSVAFLWPLFARHAFRGQGAGPPGHVSPLGRGSARLRSRHRVRAEDPDRPAIPGSLRGRGSASRLPRCRALATAASHPPASGAGGGSWKAWLRRALSIGKAGRHRSAPCGIDARGVHRDPGVLRGAHTSSFVRQRPLIRPAHRLSDRPHRHPPYSERGAALPRAPRPTAGPSR